MDISILYGARCAVVRMYIKVNNRGNDVSWKILYRDEASAEYSGTSVLTRSSLDVYGGGPLFVDLDGLSAETKYFVKLQVVDGAGVYSNGAETQEKSFTTVSDTTFSFGLTQFKNSPDGQEKFNAMLNKFKASMEAVGYDSILHVQRAPNIQESAYPNGLRVNVTADAEECISKGVGAYTSGYKGPITVRHCGASGEPLRIFLHEFRHAFGLLDGDILYHSGDPVRAGFGSTTGPAYCENVSKVVGFSRGCDTGDYEIYMFYGENSVDDVDIPKEERAGYRYISFFLLKALGLNDINIVY